MGKSSGSDQGETEARYHRLLDTSQLRGNLRARSVRGAAATLSLQLLRVALQTSVLVVLARWLTPSDFGLYGKVIAITAFIGILRNIGLGTATVQSPDVSHQQVTNLFWVNLGVGSVLAVGTGLLAPLVALFYSDSAVVGVVRGLAIVVFIGGLQGQHLAVLQRQMRFRAAAVVEVGGVFAGAVAAISCAYFNAGYWALVAQQIVAHGTCAVGWIIVSGWMPGLPRFDVKMRELLRFGWGVMGFNIVQFLSRNVDNVAIGRFVGDAAVGAYVQAYALLLMPMRLVFIPVGKVALAMLSRTAGQPQRLERAYLQMLDHLAVLTIPGVAFLIATSDWVVLLVLGEQWGAAVQIFAVLGYAALFQAVSDTSDWLFTAMGKSALLFRFGLVRAGFVIAGILVGVLWGGVMGVAWGVALSVMCAVVPLQIVLMHRYTPVSAIATLKTIAPAAILGAAILVAIKCGRMLLGVEPNPIVGLGLATLGAMGTITLCMFAIGPVRRSIHALINLRSTVLRQSVSD